MIIIIFWVLFAIAVGMLAAKRGRSGGGWFLLSLLITPLLGLIFVLVSKDLNKNDSIRVACPKCSEKVLIAATICPHCKSDLANDSAFAESVSALRRKPAEDSKNLMIGIGFIVALIVIAKLIDSF
jgi:hypothetical protein